MLQYPLQCLDHSSSPSIPPVIGSPPGCDYNVVSSALPDSIRAMRGQRLGCTWGAAVIHQTLIRGPRSPVSLPSAHGVALAATCPMNSSQLGMSDRSCFKYVDCCLKSDGSTPRMLSQVVIIHAGIVTAPRVDVIGLYNTPPSDPCSKLIHTYLKEKHDEAITFGDKSRVGRGGMTTKVKAARNVAGCAYPSGRGPALGYCTRTRDARIGTYGTRDGQVIPRYCPLVPAEKNMTSPVIPNVFPLSLNLN
eukprot:Gb_14159 [translate_table: standard]